jgi:hypothetical protein
MTFLYDAISFTVKATANKAFGLIAHASVHLNPKQLRDSADYLNALAELRESKHEGR